MNLNKQKTLALTILSFIFLAFMFTLVSCKKEEPLSRSDTPRPTKMIERTMDALINEAIAAQQVAGIPEPPLNRDATREDREKYLLASQKSIEALRNLLDAKKLEHKIGEDISPINRREEIATISKILAVELADSIDRSDDDRVKQAIRIAYTYADFVSEESIDAFLASAMITDHLMQGIRTVAKQIDSNILDILMEETERFFHKESPALNCLDNEIKRLRNWNQRIAQSTTGITVEKLIISVLDANGALTLPTDISDGLRATTEQTEGIIPPEILIRGTQVAYDIAEMTLNAAKQGKATEIKYLESKELPVASLYLYKIRSWLEFSPKLMELRQENLVLLRLFIRLCTMEPPENLEVFGEDAVSPYNLQTFDYKVTEDAFELARPRMKR
jgi:hypothetical protein